MSVFEYIFGLVGNGNNEETGKLVTLNLKSGKDLYIMDYYTLI